MTRTYLIKSGAKTIRVNSKKFAFDTVKKFFADILGGEYLGPYSIRFYSPSQGWIYCTWEF